MSASASATGSPPAATTATSTSPTATPGPSPRLDPDGGLHVADGDRRRVLPTEYVHQHVELAYASTAYGAQGQTVDTAHVVIGEHTSAAAAYVAMTRGRQHNTAHIVAESVMDARTQWADGLRARRRRPRTGACLVDGRPGHRPVRTSAGASRNAAQGDTDSSQNRQVHRPTRRPAQCPHPPSVGDEPVRGICRAVRAKAFLLVIDPDIRILVACVRAPHTICTPVGKIMAVASTRWRHCGST